MEKLYKKVYIKSEADLPKEEGEYLVKLYTKFYSIKPYSTSGGVFSPSWWISRVDWYLQPVEQDQTKQPNYRDGQTQSTAEQVKETYRNILSEDININMSEHPKNKEECQTAEEILEDYCGPIKIPYSENVSVYYPALINAMKEYANQKHLPTDEMLREAFEFGFNVLYHQEYHGRKCDCSEMVKKGDFNEWLKSKFNEK